MYKSILEQERFLTKSRGVIVGDRGSGVYNIALQQINFVLNNTQDHVIIITTNGEHTKNICEQYIPTIYHAKALDENAFEITENFCFGDIERDLKGDFLRTLASAMYFDVTKDYNISPFLQSHIEKYKNSTKKLSPVGFVNYFLDVDNNKDCEKFYYIASKYAGNPICEQQSMTPLTSQDIENAKLLILNAENSVEQISALEIAWNQTRKHYLKKEHTWIFLLEPDVFFNNEHAGMYLLQVFRSIRTYGGHMIIPINFKINFDNNLARIALCQVDACTLLRLSENQTDILEKYSMTASDIECLQNAELYHGLYFAGLEKVPDKKGLQTQWLKF